MVSDPGRFDSVGLLEWLIPLLLFAVLVGVAVYALLVLLRRPSVGQAEYPVGDQAIEQVRLRYARGEIGREDFVRLTTDLGGAPPGGIPPPAPQPPPPATPPATAPRPPAAPRPAPPGATGPS
jgi:hypothetical protein